MTEGFDTNGSEYVDWTDEDFDRADRSVKRAVISFYIALGCLVGAGLWAVLS